jgi:hypothetical protein
MDSIMRLAHSGWLFAIALSLAGCGASSAPDRVAVARAEVPAHAGSTEASAPTPADNPHAGLAGRSAPTGSSHTCTAPGFEVAGTLDACEADSTSFGAIESDAPITATDRLLQGKAVARLAPRQFVCIQLHADPVGGGEGWVYVTAIRPETIPSCKSARCGDASVRSSWNTPRTDDCRIRAGRYTRGCPAGWVRGAQVDAYSMGL